jgi:hypothetical protein
LFKLLACIDTNPGEWLRVSLGKPQSYIFTGKRNFLQCGGLRLGKPRCFAHTSSGAYPFHNYIVSLVNLRPAPGTQIQCVEGDTENIGRNETKLSSAKTDHAHHGTVDGGQNPALPVAFSQQKSRSNRKNARKVIQTKRHRSLPT